MIAVFIFNYCSTAANDLNLKGKITDKSTCKGISYAVVKQLNCSKATASNSEGYYSVALDQKCDYLVFLCIGYISDTVRVESAESKKPFNIFLVPC